MPSRRILIIGAGSIGLRHARLCKEHPDLVVEVCDSRPDGLDEARKLLGNVRAWSDLSAALASKPDLAVVATPHDSHQPIASAALRAGAHVLCEKPMTDTFASAQQLAADQQAAGRILRVGYMYHFHPGMLRLKRLLAEGTLGQLLQMRYAVGSYITLECSRSRHQRAVFGAIVMDYAHGLDLGLWLAGRAPVGAYARGIQAGRLELTSNPNVFSAVLDYAEPLLFEIHVDYVAKPQPGCVELLGDRGWARYDLLAGRLEIGRPEKEMPESETIAVERDDLYRAQIRGFLAAVEGKPDDLTTPEQGLRSVAIADALLASLRSGKREIVPTVN
ncbi:MAG: Gfo/Idh/MocA family oxidoreductase [Verrucomicrobiae bacterium]|nr:Gfo/Idh/MocA family oxidoreductase [Verrucomicrobiae bacterium]